MRVLVDAPVWSMAFRRRPADLSGEEAAAVRDLAALAAEGGAVLLGSVRQEVLTGIRGEDAFERLRRAVDCFPDEPLVPGDFVEAARSFNRCRARGIAGNGFDLLLCAVALRLGIPIFTLDDDFERYARVLPIRLHRPR